MSNIVEVVVVGDRPFFNGSLFYPGQVTSIDLDDYRDRDEDGEITGDVPELGKGKMKNLAPAGEARPVVPVEIAPIAPHAPNPINPQGLPPGGKISGSGEIVHSDGRGGSYTAVPAEGAQSNEAAEARRVQQGNALEEAAKFSTEPGTFDHDGNGAPGGAPKGGNKKK